MYIEKKVGHPIGTGLSHCTYYLFLKVAEIFGLFRSPACFNIEPWWSKQNVAFKASSLHEHPCEACRLELTAGSSPLQTSTPRRRKSTRRSARNWTPPSRNSLATKWVLVHTPIYHRRKDCLCDNYHICARLWTNCIFPPLLLLMSIASLHAQAPANFFSSSNRPVPPTSAQVNKDFLSNDCVSIKQISFASREDFAC